jgi:transposase
MASLLTDDLWEVVHPLLPRHRPSPKGGRSWSDDRKCLEGILYVLHGGIPWRLLPKEFGVSASTCWRRFRDWTAAGVWDRVHRKLLTLLGDERALDIERVIIDSASVRALFGGPIPDPTLPIGAKMAANVTSSASATVCR